MANSCASCLDIPSDLWIERSRFTLGIVLGRSGRLAGASSSESEVSGHDSAGTKKELWLSCIELGGGRLVRIRTYLGSSSVGGVGINVGQSEVDGTEVLCPWVRCCPGMTAPTGQVGQTSLAPGASAIVAEESELEYPSVLLRSFVGCLHEHE